MCKTAIDVDVTNYTRITINTNSSSGTGLKYIYVGNTSTYYAYLDVASSGEHVIDVSGATGSYPITVVVNATTNSSASLVLNSIILT